jgi:hypothetical protein
LLIIADILLFWIALLLDPQGFDPVASGAKNPVHQKTQQSKTKRKSATINDN